MKRNATHIKNILDTVDKTLQIRNDVYKYNETDMTTLNKNMESEVNKSIRKQRS